MTMHRFAAKIQPQRAAKENGPPFDIYLIVMLNVSGQCSDKGSFLHHRDPADVVSPFSYLAFVVPTTVF